MNIFLLFAAGIAGFFLFRVCRVPVPALLGPMVVTGALNAFGLYPVFPLWMLSFAANAMIGIMVGKNINRNIVRRIKALLLPVMIQLVGILGLSLLCGYMLYAMVGHDRISLMTALLSGAAGGIAEMLIFGVAADADVAVIAAVQFFRVVLFNLLLPYLSLIGRSGNGGDIPEPARGMAHLPDFSRRDYVFLIVCVTAGSAAALRASIPSGGMLGAMIAAGLLAICINKKYAFGGTLVCIAQIALGTVMGARMTPELILQLGNFLLPTVAVTVLMLTGCALLAFFLHKVTGWEMTVCALCAAPGGLSQVAVLAEECGMDSLTATVFHSVRLISIVSLYPWIILWLL